MRARRATTPNQGSTASGNDRANSGSFDGDDTCFGSDLMYLLIGEPEDSLRTHEPNKDTGGCGWFVACGLACAAIAVALAVVLRAYRSQQDELNQIIRWAMKEYELDEEKAGRLAVVVQNLLLSWERTINTVRSMVCLVTTPIGIYHSALRMRRADQNRLPTEEEFHEELRRMSKVANSELEDCRYVFETDLGTLSKPETLQCIADYSGRVTDGSSREEAELAREAFELVLQEADQALEAELETVLQRSLKELTVQGVRVAMHKYMMFRRRYRDRYITKRRLYEDAGFKHETSATASETRADNPEAIFVIDNVVSLVLSSIIVYDKIYKRWCKK